MTVVAIGGDVSVEFAGLGFKSWGVDGESVGVIKLTEQALDCEDSEHFDWIRLNNELDWI